MSRWYNVAEAFADAVARFGERNAILFDTGEFVTYRELDAQSNRAARFLASRGVRRGDRVALSLEKRPAAYALILAALKLGAPYVALDPRNPAARTRSILGQCMPRIAFTADAAAGPEWEGVDTVPCPESADSLSFCADFAAAPLEPADRVTPAQPAYLMFTSGSTGEPKGAVMSHDNLLHFVAWCADEYRFTPDDIHTHVNPLYFDNTVFDIYSTFMSGGALVPFEAQLLQQPRALVERLHAMRCSVWFSVPSLLMFLQTMKVAGRAELGTLRRIIFGGEGFPLPRLKQLYDALGPQAELHNVYGPTECTCICSSRRVSADDFRALEGFPTLGRLSPNFTQHILEGDDPVPPGEVGELCLGGCCVGLGYYNKPDLTARAFVQNPRNTAFREIIYRTGDLVRLDPADGNLYFVGRRDLQVKHMGYRIELEEIQHALADIEGVDEVAVLHRNKGELSELVAVIAAKEPGDVQAIRAALGSRVPRYMIPSSFRFIEHMPKNANGKTDRVALTQRFAS